MMAPVGPADDRDSGMDTNERARLRAQALAESEEPTPEMIAEAAEAVEPEPAIAHVGLTEELSGGAGAMYLREIANHELLTPQAEVDLAQRVERGREAARALAEAADLDDGASAELERLVEDGERARRHLIECNLRLVVSVSRRYMNRGLSFMDLVQEGNIGLQIGVDKYDWRRGFRFSTYVYWWIRQAMTRALADQSRTIRLPVHVVELLLKVTRLERELQAATGATPTIEELAERLGLEPERIVEARRAAQVPLSIEAPLGDDSDLTRGDLLGDDSAAQAVHWSAEQRELAERLTAALAALDPRERMVLRMRFGLERNDERTLNEVAATMGVSRERIRQIEQAALAKLRRMPGLRREIIEYLAA
jgi:RNA polymerase primary sigma factor